MTLAGRARAGCMLLVIAGGWCLEGSHIDSGVGMGCCYRSHAVAIVQGAVTTGLVDSGVRGLRRKMRVGAHSCELDL